MSERLSADAVKQLKQLEADLASQLNAPRKPINWAGALKPQTAALGAEKPIAASPYPIKPPTGNINATNPLKDHKALTKEQKRLLADLVGSDAKKRAAAAAILVAAGYTQIECKTILNLARRFIKPGSLAAPNAASPTGILPANVTFDQNEVTALHELSLDQGLTDRSEANLLMLRKTADEDLERQKLQLGADTEAAKNSANAGSITNKNRSFTHILADQEKSADPSVKIDVSTGKINHFDPSEISQPKPVEKSVTSSPPTDATFTQTIKPMTYEMGADPAPVVAAKPAAQGPSFNDLITMGLIPKPPGYITLADAEKMGRS